MARREAVENLRYVAPREANRDVTYPKGGFKTRDRGNRVVPRCWSPIPITARWMGFSTATVGLALVLIERCSRCDMLGPFRPEAVP